MGWRIVEWVILNIGPWIVLGCFIGVAICLVGVGWLGVQFLKDVLLK